ncbi:MAG: hypothetical protein ACK4MM_05785 [Fervidobacterium sp.]
MGKTESIFYHDRIDKLIEELSENREEMKEMLQDVITFRKRIDDLLPKKIDFRNKFIFEERMKAISNILDTELKIRKQIDDSIRSEISIRTKTVESMDDDRNIIEAIARNIELSGGSGGGISKVKSHYEPSSSSAAVLAPADGDATEVGLQKNEDGGVGNVQ